MCPGYIQIKALICSHGAGSRSRQLASAFAQSVFCVRTVDNAKKAFPCIYFSKYEKYPIMSTNTKQKMKTVNIYIQCYGSFTMASSFLLESHTFTRCISPKDFYCCQ